MPNEKKQIESPEQNVLRAVRQLRRAREQEVERLSKAVKSAETRCREKSTKVAELELKKLTEDRLKALAALDRVKKIEADLEARDGN